jgi:nucleoside-diphosphate-sugar epimerase
MSHLFCFGLGYAAGYLARRLAGKGWRVSGTATTGEGAAALSAQGFTGLVFDGRQPSAAVTEALATATHVLLSIPPDASGDPALRLHGDDIAGSADLNWIGYFSTVAVYGDAAGAWVDETTPARPASRRGERRLQAERAWLEFGGRTGKPVTIFRLPGIYGPGRSAVDDLRAGTARRIVKPGQVFNRIHVADIATAVEAAIEQPQAGAVYNVTDDLPAPPQDVVAYAAGLLGVPCPPDLDFATAHLTPMARSFYAECKRVSNARMKQELGLSLAYPTYREGLAAIAGHNPASK